MNENIAQEVLHELFSSLEALDTQSTAILQFLKRKGIATEEELAPYLEQAGDASNVRWRAARVRIDYLLSSAMKAAEQDARKEPPKTAEDSQKPRDTGTETLGTEETEKNAHGVQETASGGKPCLLYTSYLSPASFRKSGLIGVTVRTGRYLRFL